MCCATYLRLAYYPNSDAINPELFLFFLFETIQNQILYILNLNEGASDMFEYGRMGKESGFGKRAKRHVCNCLLNWVETGKHFCSKLSSPLN